MTRKSGKLAPARRVAGKIASYFILVLDGGPATDFGLGFVWHDFPAQNDAAREFDDTP
jgi:hypothetical protein